MLWPRSLISLRRFSCIFRSIKECCVRGQCQKKEDVALVVRPQGSGPQPLQCPTLDKTPPKRPELLIRVRANADAHSNAATRPWWDLCTIVIDFVDKKKGALATRLEVKEDPNERDPPTLRASIAWWRPAPKANWTSHDETLTRNGWTHSKIVAQYKLV